jgi:hypothetical protein
MNAATDMSVIGALYLLHYLCDYHGCKYAWLRLLRLKLLRPIIGVTVVPLEK